MVVSGWGRLSSPGHKIAGVGQQSAYVSHMTAYPSLQTHPFARGSCSLIVFNVFTHKW